MAPGFPTPASLSFPDSLLYDLLDVSLTGVNVLRPVYDPAGEIEDFAIEYLNPAGQRMAGLAERPGGTLLTRFPESKAAGILAYYRRAYTEGYPGLHEVNYQADGLDNFFRLAARRSGELLVVSFTDTADQNRSAVELALRESQVAEQAARADAQRQRLLEFMDAAPGMVLRLVGPQHVIEFANEGFRQQFGVPDPVGKPYLEALPVAATQDDSAYQATALYDHIYRTGEPYYAAEAPYYIAPPQAGRRELRYFTFAVQAARDGRGRIVGVQAFATDVTAQVLARQQVEQLNQELEARVQARTRELAQAQAETEAQRQRLHQLVAEAPALIASLRGPEHVVELANDGFRAIFGGRELVGKTYREAIPEFAGQPFFDRLDRVYRTGETYHGIDEPVVLDRTNSGQLERTFITYTYQATRDVHGRIDGILVFCYEVTDQVMARQEREAQREQLQAVFAQAPVAVCLFRGENSVFDVVNPPMAEMLGHPLEALVGHPFFEVMPELRAQGLPELLAEVRRTGTPYVAQEQAIQLLRHQPGAPGYYNFVYQPLFDAQHQVTGIVCVVTDVSEQVAARRVVEAREESFRLMADHAPAMLWVTDPAGQCTYLNAQWYAYTGQTEAEALGLGWTQAVHPDDADAAGTAFLDANDRRVPFEFLYRLRRHDGKYRWAIDRGLPRFGPDGAFAGIVGTVVEVHEQKLAELALQKLTKKLRKSRDQAEALNAELGTTNQQLLRTNVDLDNFIYTASHDLKAPISNLEGLLHLLQLELPPALAESPTVGPVLGHMLDAVDRFKRTIDHLTELSKLQKEHAPATTLVNLAAVVEGVRQDLAPQLRESKAQLTVAVSEGSAFHFSEKNLRSVVYNLLSNALKYRHPDRRLHVDVRSHVREGFTVLEVHDNGLGLDPDHLPRLFTMFQRFHDHVEGTGIGLFMLKRMVDNAGGRVEVHSRLGAGTTFFVHLPHAAPAA
ncbi:PAS domain-containing sensor histidine kinase [Hymenobacter psychrophilus]|uniref:histidine kinase n=1 Tax=Hymenobacter psychrophilus TaxID=651662 RepID=A0A1H3P0G7_9BACT|nr:PAS domain-containing protein [Hymenobacter psychrophilus]SDY94616.1 PAS domain S-box-containing protein [Hymenobacter psychrophilus]